MGSVCCCLSVENFEDYVNPNSSVYRNCMCLSCFIHNFLNVYTSIFRRREGHSAPLSIQGAASMTSTASLDNSLSDMYRPPPRPLPYDADPRYFLSQRDGLVSRREKGSSHSNEESQPLRSDLDGDSESLNMGDKWNECACENGSKEYHSKTSLRLSSAKCAAGLGLVYVSLEDEDVCPTCLEEYTRENPKIMTKCSHHFHLGCIYEWMERSENCPVCGKLRATFLNFIFSVEQSSNFKDGNWNNEIERVMMIWNSMKRLNPIEEVCVADEARTKARGKRKNTSVDIVNTTD